MQRMLRKRHHVGARISELSSNLLKKVSSLCRKHRDQSHDEQIFDTLVNDKEDRDPSEEDQGTLDEDAQIVLLHSRLAWPPSETVSTEQAGPNPSESQSTVESSFTQVLCQNLFYNAFRDSDKLSWSALSTVPQTPSPPRGHSRALERQNYAHDAWTPPEGVPILSEEEECEHRESFVRELTERCKDKAKDGAFDEEVIDLRFSRSYCHRTTQYEQWLASADFCRIVEANANRERLEFEKFHKQNDAEAEPPKPRVTSNLEGYQIEFNSSMSSLGDIVGEVMRRSGGTGFS